jgi:iron complex outermembrane receptor protein
MKVKIAVNNTLFGPTKFKQQGMSNDLYWFETKLVTDLAVTYSLTESTVRLNINNIFNVLPQWNFKAENAAGRPFEQRAAELKKPVKT